MNFAVVFLTALIPLIIGFIWYNNKVFGNAWMAASGMTPEHAKSNNMLKVFSLTYLLSVFIATILMAVTIHQTHLFSIFANDPTMRDPNSEVSKLLADIMAKYGNNFRTFKHGAFHGVIFTIMLVMPVIGINAIFERRSFKYVAIHTGFWLVSIALMGGCICQFIKLG